MNSTVRERRFTWHDPRDVARAIMGRPHLEWMGDMIAGNVPPPPFASTLGFVFEESERGRVRFSVEVHEWAANPAGVVHGGFTAALLDTVMTLAVTTKIPADRVATTLDLHLHYVRPLFPNGQKITAEATAIHTGATIGTAEGRILDADGRLIAHGTTTLAIIIPQAPR